MRFIRHLKFLPLLLLTLAILIVPSQTAYANSGGVGDYDGTGGNTSGGTGVDIPIMIGWSDQYVGYRIYAMQEGSHKEATEVKDVWFGSGTYEKVLDLTSNGMRRSAYWGLSRAGIKTKVDGQYSCEQLGDGNMPRPWTGFSSNAELLKAWIYTEDENGVPNGLRIIEQLFGEDILEQYLNSDEEFYIILEGIAAFDLLDRYNNNTTGIFAGSAYNYGIVCMGDWNMPYGNVWLRRGTNGVFGIAMYLDETWPGTNYFGAMIIPTRTSVGTDPNVATQFLSGDELQDYGYDTHQYTFSSVLKLRTHTWDYALGETPGPAPKPTLPSGSLINPDNAGKVSIVKVYCTKDTETGDVISWDGSFIRRQTFPIIDIEDEPTYVVEQWKTSTIATYSPPSTWDPVEPIPGVQKGTSPGTVELDTEDKHEKTLYVLLVKYEEAPEAGIILHESEITKNYQFSQVSDWQGVNRTLTWTSESLSLGSCGVTGIHNNHGHDIYGNTIGCGCRCGSTGVTITDSSLMLKARNDLENSYSKILAVGSSPFKAKIIPESGVSKTRYTSDSFTASAIFDYKFVVWRGNDNITLSNWKINGESTNWQNSTINNLVNRQSNTPQSTRWTDRVTMVPLTIQITEDPSGDYLSASRRSCGHDGGKETRATFNGPFSGSIDVQVETYSGKDSSGSVANSLPTLPTMSGVTSGNGRYVTEDAPTISFYPYIRMTYETIGDSSKKDANVLGQYKRSLKVYDYAEAGYISSYPNLVISSQQWSTHAMATDTDVHPYNGRNKVLPGGALYNISSGNGGSTLVLRTWQFVSEGENRTRLSEAGTQFSSTGNTVSSAQSAHKEFVNSAVTAFNNGYYIEQIVNSDPNKSEANITSGSYITVAKGMSSLSGTRLSSEDKYWLDSSKGGTIQSNLLKASEKGTTTKVYRVYSDTFGNVYLASGGSVGAAQGASGTKILSKDQGVSKLTNSEAKQLDARTRVISNFLGAIERNTGDDETASWATEDGKWYNESFELYVMVQTTQVSVGLNSPAKRELVLDPALTPKNSGKSDFFSTAYSSMWRMGASSVTAPDKGAGYAGTFKDVDINISNITNMFKSKVFVIPNVNVQDLKD